MIYTPTQNGGATFSIENVSRDGVVGIDNVSLAVVPEPTATATILLGAAGLAGFVVRRRLRQS